MQRTRSSIHSVKGPFFIAIGVSGSRGLRDIEALLGALPAALPAVVLVVLHRPSDKVSHLARVLGRAAHMPVLAAAEDAVFRIAHCYVGEPDGHLALAARSMVRLVEGVRPGRAK
jgi:chemotaxis response regulator CheB